MAATPQVRAESPLDSAQVPEIPYVFRGRELTRKTHRLSSGLPSVDDALGGGLVRGRINEIVGRAGVGKTSLAAAFLARATADGEVAAWIDSAAAFDPSSMRAAGVDLARVLWVGCPGSHPGGARQLEKNFLKAAELVLETGGFGLIVVDFGDRTLPLMTSAALRMARRAERTSTAMLILAAHRMCATFAALTLNLIHSEARFSRPSRLAPALFDGCAIDARVARNKLGGAGRAATWQAQIDPGIVAPAPSPASPQTKYFDAR
ncbi:MAG TPA: ATPase domain-containing protein [Candidatus Binataceae bacterium]|nr:ATPase domain-containing protein [Candidatus Binataceae bacterium]